VIRIVTMRIEAGRIAARTIVQGATSLRMPRGGSRRSGEAKRCHAGERPAGGGQEVTS
jgi:hypothetical protein